MANWSALHVPLWWVWVATGCICLQWEGWKLDAGASWKLKVESGSYCCSKVKEHWSLSLWVCNISFACFQEGLSCKKSKKEGMKWKHKVEENCGLDEDWAHTRLSLKRWQIQIQMWIKMQVQTLIQKEIQRWMRQAEGKETRQGVESRKVAAWGQWTSCSATILCKYKYRHNTNTYRQIQKQTVDQLLCHNFLQIQILTQHTHRQIQIHTVDELLCYNFVQIQISTQHIYRQIQIQTVDDLLCYNSLQGNLTENCAAAAYKVYFKNFQEVAGCRAVNVEQQDRADSGPAGWTLAKIILSCC